MSSLWKETPNFFQLRFPCFEFRQKSFKAVKTLLYLPALIHSGKASSTDTGVWRAMQTSAGFSLEKCPNHILTNVIFQCEPITPWKFKSDWQEPEEDTKPYNSIIRGLKSHSLNQAFLVQWTNYLPSWKNFFHQSKCYLIWSIYGLLSLFNAIKAIIMNKGKATPCKFPSLHGLQIRNSWPAIKQCSKVWLLKLQYRAIQIRHDC